MGGEPAIGVPRFPQLQNRGVRDILIAAIDGLAGFPEAVATVFPKTQVQLCIVHMVRGSLRYVARKERKAVSRDLRAIYRAPTLEAGVCSLCAQPYRSRDFRRPAAQRTRPMPLRGSRVAAAQNRRTR